jgi:hypothetical protein
LHFAALISRTSHWFRREALRRLIASKLALCVSANNASLNSMTTVTSYNATIDVTLIVCSRDEPRRGLSGLN